MINDEKIIAGLLANPTITKTAEVLGISEETIYSRLRDADFSKKYDECMVEMLGDSVKSLQKKIQLAVDTFAEIASDNTCKDSARVSASDSIIKNFVRLDEHFYILRKLEQIETELNEYKKEDLL